MSAPLEDEMAPWTPTRLGEGASHALGGVPGRISASCRQKCFWAPAIFLWYRQAAPSLSKKEMVGPTVLPPGGRNLSSCGPRTQMDRAALCAESFASRRENY